MEITTAIASLMKKTFTLQEVGYAAAVILVCLVFFTIALYLDYKDTDK